MPRIPLQAVTFALVVGTSAACSSTLGSPEDLAKSIGVASIHQEDEILSTCRALEAAEVPKTSANKDNRASAGALVQHLRADRRNRARSLLGMATGAQSPLGADVVADESLDAILDCSRNADTCKGATDALSAKLTIGTDDAAHVIASSVGGTLTADALLAKLPLLTHQFNFAHATVLGLAQVSSIVEGLVDDVADSFGFFKAFASPLLKLVAAELIAVGMDVVLTELEKTDAVSPASVALQACRIHDKIDPSAEVTGRVMRRAILRFSPGSYASTSGLKAACTLLSKQSGDDVCAEVAHDKLGITPKKGTTFESSFDAAIEPSPTEAEVASFETKVSPTQTSAFKEAATLCIREAKSDDEARRCTIDRVADVASLIAEMQKLGAQTHEDFGALESRLSALEGSYAELSNRYADLATRYAELSATQAALREDLKTKLAPVGGLSQQITDAKQEILGAVRAPGPLKCPDYIRSVMAERTNFAKTELDARDSTGSFQCSSTWDDTARTTEIVTTKFKGVTFTKDEFCEKRMVSVRVDVSFPTNGSGAALWTCPSTKCLDPGFASLLQRIAGQSDGNLVFIGSADELPIIVGARKPLRDALDAKLLAAGSSFDWKAGTDEDAVYQRALSMLRVLSVIDEVDPKSKRISREALGKLGQARRVQVGFALPKLVLDLAKNCSR